MEGHTAHFRGEDNFTLFQKSPQELKKFIILESTEKRTSVTPLVVWIELAGGDEEFLLPPSPGSQQLF